MKQVKTAFFCQGCGYQSAKWLGKCPSCNEWNQFAEEKISPDEKETLTPFGTPPLPINDIPIEETERIKTGVEEIDRVLGGGIVNGSVQRLCCRS